LVEARGGRGSRRRRRRRETYIHKRDKRREERA
jgi:hypothetical protein